MLNMRPTRAHAPVPCQTCSRTMPAGRLKIPSLSGMCTSCTDARRMARPEPPMYETDAWSRGIKL